MDERRDSLTETMVATPWSRLLSRSVQFSLDVAVLVSSFGLSYLLRYEFAIDQKEFLRALAQLPFVVFFQFSALFLGGAYSLIWRYIALTELKVFVKAAFWSALLLVLLRLGLGDEYHTWRVPLSVILMDTVLAFGGVLSLRVLRRVLYERYERALRPTSGDGKPVLLVGAGRAGVLAVKEIQGRGNLGLDVRGFVDDDPAKQGAVIQGVKVLGTTRDIPRLAREHGFDHAVITIAKAGRTEMRRIVEVCESVPLKVRVIPGLYELLSGSVEVSRIRDVQIEDLLGREVVQLDQEVVSSFVRGKTVMVTGAGGSIGSELARQVAHLEAGALLLVERAEFALFDVDRELRQKWPGLNLVPLVADVGDRERMQSLLATHRPSLVVHAAAHKHVPLMETNPTEAVKNNILATGTLGELAGEAGAEAFILISTDKAVRPASVMGASKRVAELVVQDLDRRYSTRYVAVRFGNVLGSAGSVIPIFRQQILTGGPVTVTHPDMVRYFMTIPEAAQLVLQAGAMGEGGEIFILDMGEPVRILDMAKDMIGLFGLKPFEDVDIVFTGMRPGEKLFEELETVGESIAKTRHPKIFVGKVAGCDPATLGEAMARFRDLAVDGQEKELRACFGKLLPEARLTT